MKLVDFCCIYYINPNDQINERINERSNTHYAEAHRMVYLLRLCFGLDKGCPCKELLRAHWDEQIVVAERTV